MYVSGEVDDCGIKNNRLKEPFFTVNIMLRLNKSGRFETTEKHSYLKSYEQSQQKLTININNQISIQSFKFYFLKRKFTRFL